MKKLLYSILALAGVTFASCTQEHIDVQYIPENAVAPVLGAIEGCELQDGGADIVVEYTKADFGVATAQAHNLYISKSEDMADMKKAKATFGDSTITMTQSDINVVALDLAEAGAEVDLYFAIVANLNTDKGAAVAGTELQSNVVKATFKSYVADILPTEKFDKVWVIGDYCGWAHDKTQFLFDYNSTGSTYSGIVDFNKDGASAAANGFKLTGVAGWDDACNWGLEDNTTAEAEASSLQLITGGGSQDIKAYAKRFYGFEFDKTTLVLKKTWGADQIGIIGLNGDWETDIVMEYNPKWTRFYADIEAPADTEMKFRADAGWDLNWGVDCAQGGGNIAVAAGNYRVYFNPATGLIEFSAKAYGTEEDTGANGGTTPEPEPTETTYGLIGSFNGWGEPDVDLVARGDGWYVVKEVVIPAADENKFLIRLNDAWSNKFGFAEANTFVTIDGKNTLTAEGQDMWIADGTFDFYFNPTSAELYVMTAGAADPTLPQDAKAVKFYADVTATGWTNCNIYGWGDLGDYGGSWPGTALSSENVDGKEYYTFTFDASAWGKTVNVIFNNGTEQTVDIKDIILDKDYIFTLTDNAGGKWNATINGEAPVTPEPPAETTYGLIGDFNGWGADVDLVARGDGWYVTEGLSVTAGKLLIRLNDAWDEKFGNDGSTLVIGENTLTYGGADMLIEEGNYDFYFNPSSSKLFLVNAGDEDPTAGLVASISYGLVGTINGWAAPDVKFEAIGDGGYKLLGYTLAATEQIKIRANEEWNDAENYGLASAGVLTTNAANTLICGGGSANMSVAADGTYDFYFYPAELTLYVMEAGQVPTR